MPNTCTHLVFGARVAAAVGKPLESLGKTYLLGCLGPDYYFYDRLPPTPFIPHQKKHGNRLHEFDCDVLFTALKNAADDSLKPYLYGFLTHIALDSTVHPYVDSAHCGSAHSRFEGVIDSIVYEKTKDEFPYEAVFRQRVDAEKIDDLLARVSETLCGASVKGAYVRGLRKFRRAVPVLHDPKGGKYRSLRRMERLIKKPGFVSDFMIGGGHEDPDDCLNLSRRPWRSPWEPDRERNESVPMLIEEAMSLAVSLIRAFDADDTETLSALLQNRTMKKGKPV